MAAPVAAIVRTLVRGAVRGALSAGQGGQGGRGVQVAVELRGQKAVQELLGKMSGVQAKQAYAKALNDTGFKGRRGLQRELSGRFDRVTPFVRTSPKVFAATPEKLSVAIAPTLDSRNRPSRGGKVGVDPQNVLQAQEWGGRRADKRSEVALRRAGILPNGMQTVIPAQPYPGSDDGRGNLRGAFVSQLISYLQASGEQGYRANMKAKAKARIEDRTRMSLLSNRREVKVIRGHAFFVSYGRSRGSHLAPGVWAKSGTHGADVKPVLMFVRRPSYNPRISMDRVVQEANLQSYLDRRVRYRVREAFGV